MIDTQSIYARPEAEPMVVNSEVASSSQTTGAEYFLRFVVIVLGIFLGVIAAVFIGLVTGWINIAC